MGGCHSLFLPNGADGSSELSEGESHFARTAKIDGWEQEIVNIYCVYENDLYGCFRHVQLDISKERLIAVLDTTAEISLTPKGIFEDLLAKGFRVPQLPIVNGALITGLGNRTERIKRQALIEFEIDGVSYEQVFMIALNLVPGAILGISLLKENNVVINLIEGRFKMRRDGSDCEHKYFCDSSPKNRVGVGLISSPKFQLNFSELQKQSDGLKGFYSGCSDRTRIDSCAPAKSAGLT